MLPEAFQGFAGFNQYILWRLIPNPAGGKDKKVPINPMTSVAVNPHDPINWLPFDVAEALAPKINAQVGFVFTAADPFWFIDVDSAWDGTQWSQVAQNVFASFPGACFELSQSGTGFHLFGRYNTAAVHSNRRDDLGVELYIAERFCAHTFNQASGGWPDLDINYQQFAVSWFPPKAITGTVEWVDVTDPNWAGPLDDNELVTKMLASRPSMATLEGKTASVKQLWEADPALGIFFPDPERPFNHNQVDLALCTKLAFWAGKNPVRIERLFGMSGLNRDKWVEREKYRHDTIQMGISYCEKVLGEGLQSQTAAAVTTEVAPAAATNSLSTGYQLLAPDQQLTYFNGCVYVSDKHAVFTPNGMFLKPPQFRSRYGGYVFAMESDSSKTTENAFLAFTESRAFRAPKVDSTTFRPEDPPGTFYDEGGLSMVNSYVPVKTPSIAGDVSPFLGLIYAMYPNERDRLIIISYLAALVQYPGKKFQWAILMQGVQGNGKTFILYAMLYAIGRKYTHLPNARDLSNIFNAWITEKLLIGVEEMFMNDNPEVAEALKEMVTNSIMGVQGKGADQTTGDNRANFIFCSNRKDAVIKSASDRRYCPLFAAQQAVEDLARDGMGGRYFPDLWEWLNREGHAYITHFLQNFQIPDALNPATDCHRAPVTSSTNEAIALSATRAHELILEAIEEHRVGFRHGWISSIHLALLTEHERRISRRDVFTALADLGYVHHPALPGGRLTHPLPNEGNRRPRIYVVRDSIQSRLPKHEVLAAYLKAQQEETPPDATGTGTLAIQ